MARVVHLSVVVAAAILPARPVLAQAPKIQTKTAVAIDVDITAPLKGVTTTKGIGATAALAMTGGNAQGAMATVDPSASGKAFDDTVPFGTTKALSGFQTGTIGLQVLKVYPNYPGKDSETKLGESLRYNVSGPSDKVGPALGPQGFAQIESTALASTAPVTPSAVGTITSVQNEANAKAVDVTGLATASITFGNPFNPDVPAIGRGFAIGIAKDPITYTLTSPGTTSTIDEALGDSSNPLSLQASIPGSFATAFLDFGTDQTGLLASFTIGIDSQTQSEDQVDFEVSYLSPLLGYATTTAFESAFLSDLTFNPSDQTLSSSTGIPLFQVTLSDASPSATLWYTEGAIVGVAVPEPHSIFLMGAGIVGVLATCVALRSFRSTPRPALAGRG
jgi:hypothetical protein